MSDDDKQTHYDLLHRIERNDRRFRLAQSVFMSAVGLVLVGLIAAQFFVIQQFKDQSAERAAGLKTLASNAQHNTELSNQYLQCIARFFATTDRSTRVLTDLDQCIYEQNGQVIPGLDTQATGAASSDSPAPVTPQTTPTQSSGAGESTTPVTTHPAVEVLGIPVCVPLTGICLRQ